MIRNSYDLSNMSFRTGRLGQWSVLNVLPVVAGDSVEYRVRTVVQQSPLRRQIVMSPQIDIITAFVPHRFCCDQDDWVQFIEDGVDTDVTFSALNIEADCRYLPWAFTDNGSAPFYYDGIRQIWQRFMRPPSSPVTWSKSANDWTFQNRGSVGSAQDWRAWGPFATALPDLYSGGIISDIDPEDYSVSVDDASDTFSILDFARVQARYKSEIGREYYGQRYNEVMKYMFSSDPGYMAEEIPEILRVSTHDLDGQEIRGVGDNTLGQPVGLGRGSCYHEVPRRYFDEHGCIWTLAVVRYPHVYSEEAHYLNLNALTYKVLSGDPTILDNEAPKLYTADEFFIGGSSAVDLLSMPYAQWYRHQPNIVDPRFSFIKGYPFIPDIPSDPTSVMWFNQDMAATLFASTPAGHHQFYTTNDVEVERVVPPASHSLNAGGR